VLGGAWLAGTLAALTGATGWNPAAADVVRGHVGGSLFVALEAARLRARGTDVLLLEPAEPDLEAMGDDLMDAGRASRVAEVATATAGAALRRLPGDSP